MKGFGDIVKHAQRIQKEMEKIQEELAQKKVEGASGGGMVTVQANGNQEILSVKIDPEVINQNEKEMLEDLVVAATNEALRKAKELLKTEIAKATGGLNLPPGLGI